MILYLVIDKLLPFETMLIVEEDEECGGCDFANIFFALSDFPKMSSL
jgi:hypothetical protein